MSIPTLDTIESGLARCGAEPRGSHSLEGYGLEQFYKFETFGDGVLAGYFETVAVEG